MKKAVLLVLLLFACCGCLTELNLSNFEDAIGASKFVYVVFCVRWSGACSRFLQDWTRIERQLEDTLRTHNISLAVVDADRSASLVEDERVHDYPTVKLYTGELIVDFDAKIPLTEQSALAFIRKTSVEPVRPLAGGQEPDSELQPSQLAVLFRGRRTIRGERSPEYEVFESMAIFKNREQSVFYFTEIDQPAEVVIKSKDFGESKFDGQFTLENLVTFYSQCKFSSLVSCSNHEAMSPVTEGLSSGLLLFYDREDHGLVAGFKQLARTKTPKVIFALCDVKNEEVQSIYQSLFDFKSFPALAFIRLDHDRYKKYPVEAGSVEQINEQMRLYLEGRLEPYFRTEPLPREGEAEEAPLLKKLVGSNFMQTVSNPNYYYLVYLTSSDCSYCRTVPARSSDPERSRGCRAAVRQ